MTQSNNETSVNSIRPMTPNDAQKITRDYAEPLQNLDDATSRLELALYLAIGLAVFAVCFVLAVRVLSS